MPDVFIGHTYICVRLAEAHFFLSCPTPWGQPTIDGEHSVMVQGSSFSSTTPSISAVPEAGTATSLSIGLAILAGITLIARRRVKIHNA